MQLRVILRMFFVFAFVFLVLRFGPARFDAQGWTNMAYAIRSLDPTMIVQAQTFTHYVVVGGSTSSNCTLAVPCNWNRAQIFVPCGSDISLGAGTHRDSHGDLGLSCTAANPRRWWGQGGPGGVVTTGLQEELPFSAWTLSNRCGGTGDQPCVYTYEQTWDDEARGWAPVGISHAIGGDVPTIHAFEAYDCMPFTVGGGCEDNPLDFAPATLKYNTNTTVQRVENQFGQWMFDDATNTIFIHLFVDTGPPTDAMDLYVMRQSFGHIPMAGDYQMYDNITVHAANSGGYCIQFLSTADHVTFTNFHVMGCAFILNGTNHTIDGLVVEGAWGGSPTYTPPTQVGNTLSGCMDGNPTFGSQECLNENGGGEAFAVLGSGHTVRHVESKNSWGSGVSLQANNTVLEDAIIRDTVNHLCSIGAEVAGHTNITYRRVFCINGQESIFSGLVAANYTLTNFTMEHSVMYPNPVIGSLSGLNLHHNLFLANIAIGSPAFDDPALQMNCNVYFGANITRYPAGPTYTFAQLQALGRGLETNGKLLTSGQKDDGSQFISVDFTQAPALPWPWDFHPVNDATEVVNMSGCSPDYAGPYDLPAGQESTAFRLRFVGLMWSALWGDVERPFDPIRAYWARVLGDRDLYKTRLPRYIQDGLR